MPAELRYKKMSRKPTTNTTEHLTILQITGRRRCREVHSLIPIRASNCLAPGYRVEYGGPAMPLHTFRPLRVRCRIN